MPRLIQNREEFPMSRMDGSANLENNIAADKDLRPERPQRYRTMENQETSPEFHANNLGGPGNGPTR